MKPSRARRLEPIDPGGEPICRLTPEGARGRRAPIDRVLAQGTFEPRAAGYEIRLPAGEESWALANAFAEEEALCCPTLALELEEHADSVAITATFSAPTPGL